MMQWWMQQTKQNTRRQRETWTSYKSSGASVLGRHTSIVLLHYLLFRWRCFILSSGMWGYNLYWSQSIANSPWMLTRAHARRTLAMAEATNSVPNPHATHTHYAYISVHPQRSQFGPSSHWGSRPSRVGHAADGPWVESTSTRASGWLALPLWALTSPSLLEPA